MKVFGSSCFRPKRNQVTNRIIRRFISTQDRSLNIVEPPLSVSIERPVTVLLLEDGLYAKSWSDLLKSKLPSEMGISYGTIHVPSTAKETFRDRVEFLKEELLGIPDALVVARGPIASWSCQLYLESFSLIGMVAVDPILMDRRGSIEDKAIQYLLQQNNSNEALPWDRDLLCRVLSGNEDRKLKLEPGPCPMLFVQSLPSDLFTQTTRDNLKRHDSDESPFGSPIFIDIHQQGERDFLSTLSDWIDDHVL
jgi:hypothetical protein